jgi:hypothetical protein
MNLLSMDYFLADHLDYLRGEGFSGDYCDGKAEDYSNQVHLCLHSFLWEDSWMD